VNLLAVVRPNMQYMRIADLCGKTLRHRSARYAFPSLERLGAQRPLLFCVGVVTAILEQIGYLIVDRSETLQVARRLEAAHHLLAYPLWLS